MNRSILFPILIFEVIALNGANLVKKALPINYDYGSQFFTSRISVKGNQDDTLYYDNGDLDDYDTTTGWYGVIFYHAYPCTLKGAYVSFLGTSTDSSTLYAIDFKQDNPNSLSVKDSVKFISNGYPDWTYVPLKSPWVDSNHFTLLVSIPPTLPVIDNQPNHTDPVWGISASLWYDPTSGASAFLDGNLLLRASVNFENAHDIAANNFVDSDREGIFVYAGDTISPVGTILNRGENDETDVPVALTIYNGADTVYSDTVTDASILVDTLDTLNFADFSDTVLGNYTTSLRYLGGDYLPHNDEISVDLGIVKYPGELYYDDGSVDDIHIRDAGNAWAVKFVSPRYPVVLDTIKIYFSSYSGSGDRNDAYFGIYDDDGPNGLPGTPLLFDSLINRIPLLNQWNVIGIKKEGIRIDSGAFYVVYQQYGNYPDAPAMAFNETPPVSRNTYYFDGTNWSLWDKTEEEAMLRVSVSNIFDNDVGIYSVEAPTKYSPADSVVPIITVKNYGTNPANFDAICTIDASGNIVYADTVPVAGLSYNEMKQIEFSPWLPAAVSGQVYNVSFNLDMIGDGDVSNNTSTFTTTVIFNMDYLVWDPDPDSSSGPVVDSILKSKGYQGIYLRDITDVESVINEFASIFIFLGQFHNNYIVNASGKEAAIISNYIPGGNTYLEGGDVWFNPSHTGFNFNPYFGITAVSDGSGGSISQSLGIPGAFTDGMTFTYSGESNWTDFVKTNTTITPGAVMAFTDGAGDTIGFYRDAGTYKTWGFTAEFSGLDDSTAPSTKSALLDTIMHFFGFTKSFAQPNNIVTGINAFKITPNPFLLNTTIRFSVAKKGNVSIKIYDTAGRCVNTLINKPFKEGNYTIKWNGKDDKNSVLPAGIYFSRIKTGNSVKSLKLIKLR